MEEEDGEEDDEERGGLNGDGVNEAEDTGLATFELDNADDAEQDRNAICEIWMRSRKIIK